MSHPKRLSKYEAAEALTPLVWPLIGDKALVVGPGPCNEYTNGVTIQYGGQETTLTTEQYELFRVQVLQYISEHYYLKPISFVLGIAELESNIIKNRILEVFDTE